MRPDGQPFEHWNYRRLGDPGLNAASVTLLNRLLSEGRLSAPRAWLMRRGLPVSVRQALRFDFTAPTPLAGQPGRYHRLWLVEQGMPVAHILYDGTLEPHAETRRCLRRTPGSVSHRRRA